MALALSSVPPKRRRTYPEGRIYVHLRGRLHRITAAEGTADFDRQYWEILTGKRMQAKTSWAALMDDYRKSDRWTGLKPRTRQDYDKVMDYLREKIGTCEVKALNHARKGALHLFGHVHGNWKGSSNAVNVGVDVWDFYPVTVQDAARRAKALPANRHWKDVEPRA